MSILGLIDSVDGRGIPDASNLFASLVDGKVPSTQLPSYVDDVIEVQDFASLPATGETSKIYLTLDDNKQYRWGGSVYVELYSGVTLGETSATAYRGDRGKIAYDHSQGDGSDHSQVEQNTSDISRKLSSVTTDATLTGNGTVESPLSVANGGGGEDWITLTESSNIKVNKKYIVSAEASQVLLTVDSSINGSLIIQTRKTPLGVKIDAGTVNDWLADYSITLVTIENNIVTLIRIDEGTAYEDRDGIFDGVPEIKIHEFILRQPKNLNGYKLNIDIKDSNDVNNLLQISNRIVFEGFKNGIITLNMSLDVSQVSVDINKDEYWGLPEIAGMYYGIVVLKDIKAQFDIVAYHMYLDTPTTNSNYPLLTTINASEVTLSQGYISGKPVFAVNAHKKSFVYINGGELNSNRVINCSKSQVNFKSLDGSADNESWVSDGGLLVNGGGSIPGGYEKYDCGRYVTA